MQVLTLVFSQPVADDTFKTELSSALSAFLPVLKVAQKNAQVFLIKTTADASLSPALRAYLYQLGADFALQPQALSTKQLCFSDMDATMVVGETIDEMARAVGQFEAIAALTAKAMQGQMCYEEALKQRLALLTTLNKATIEALTTQIHYAPGAKTLLAGLNAKGIESCLISGGFVDFAAVAAKTLGFTHYIANQLCFDENGYLLPDWQGELIDKHAKARFLKQFAKARDLPLSATIAIGDGANDALMIESVAKQGGLGVAYCAKPVLRAVANAEIHTGQLHHLLSFLDFSGTDFEISDCK